MEILSTNYIWKVAEGMATFWQPGLPAYSDSSVPAHSRAYNKMDLEGVTVIRIESWCPGRQRVSQGSHTYPMGAKEEPSLEAHPPVS